jgi:hypothetical protein
MNVERIWSADVCRDGGSYSLCFDADDGRWYEFFLQTRAFEGDGPSHLPPVIYLEGVNGGHEVQRLTWDQARQFLGPLRFDNARFAELIEIVQRGGLDRA